jgi:hypothetical protein
MNEDLQTIINLSLEYATDMLEQSAELHPFGAFTDNSGQVHPVEMEINKKDIPTNGKIIETLWNMCIEEMENDRISAFGITFESSLKFSENEESKDVIVVIPKHITEENLPAYCTPFTISKEGNVETGEMFAVDSKFFN